jgi:hypothetical protein
MIRFQRILHVAPMPQFGDAEVLHGKRMPSTGSRRGL